LIFEDIHSRRLDMTTPIVRRATLTALVLAALAAPALAQTAPPPGSSDDRGPRMARHHERGDRGDYRHMRMRWSGGGMQSMLGMVPMRPGQEFRFSEGRLAFLKAELKLNEAQTKLWDAFAAALRENAAKLQEAYKAPDREAIEKWGPADRLGWAEKALAARLDAVKRAKAALEPLYAALGDDQKKTFDRFMPTGGQRARFRERMGERRERMHDRWERRMERRGRDRD
jgi:hypothetical protein